MDSYTKRIEQKIRETVDPNFKISKMQMDSDELKTQAANLFPGFIQKINKKINPQKQLKFEFIDSPDINSSVDTDDHNAIHIYINWGMTNFVFKMIKLFLSRMGVRNDKQIIEESHISQEEMLVVADQLMSSFWDGNIWKVPSFELTQLNKGQIELGSYLLKYSECFIVAHELGHIILNVFPENAKKELYIATSANERHIIEFLESLSIDEVARNFAIEKWPYEFAADLLGLELCLQERNDSAGRSAIRASAELVLIALQMLEKYFFKKHGQDYLQYVYEKKQQISHPPFNLRWEFIHSYVDPRCPQGDISGLGLAFKQFSDFLSGDHQSDSIGR